MLRSSCCETVQRRPNHEYESKSHACDNFSSSNIKLRQAVQLKRELDKKTRALSVLLRDDWAKVALEREREIRAVRVQLAQTEAHLEEQLDTMVERLLASVKKQSRIGRKDEQSSEGCRNAVGNTPEENHGNPAEVFVGEAGAEGGMVALQVCCGMGGK